MRRLLLLAVLLAGCKGADGATGPTGPAGAVGPAGPPGSSATTNRADLSGVIPSGGTVSGLLPAASVASGRLPAIACFISDVGQTWLQVADTPGTSTETYCGLGGIGTSTPQITLINGPVGWRYYLLALW